MRCNVYSYHRDNDLPKCITMYRVQHWIWILECNRVTMPCDNGTLETRRYLVVFLSSNLSAQSRPPWDARWTERSIYPTSHIAFRPIKSVEKIARAFYSKDALSIFVVSVLRLDPLAAQGGPSAPCTLPATWLFDQLHWRKRLQDSVTSFNKP